MTGQSIPQHHPSPRELDDLELLTTGAAAPLRGFDEPGSPLTLTLPEELRGAPTVELVDAEGLPLARVSQGGGIEVLTHAQHGPFRRLHLDVATVRERYAGRTFVPVSDALTSGEIEELRRLGPVVLLALVGTGTPELSAVALLRASIAAADLLEDAAVVAVPLASRGDADVDHSLGVQVVGNYAAGDPVHALTADDESDYPPAIAAIVAEDQPAPDEQGLVVFFTGLSGSGKSTLAQALMDRLLERGGRSVTSLDGDVVRRHLSAGLTFSKEDRETNIRRIGWVAAEVSRHGGVAVCSPIAPFDRTRREVRQLVEEAGGAFFLVHVATPLEECERRDRKGLYAKARRGQIPEFTGISSPYEEPEDSAVRVDTTGRTIEAALDDVLEKLAEEGYVDLRGSAPAPARDGLLTPPAALRRATTPAASSADGPLRVLFVCTANICRSPAMELAARDLAGERLTISSAGTHGFTDKPMDDIMADTLGLDASAFRSRRLTAALVDEADVILTAEASHRQFIIEEFPHVFRRVFTLGQFVADAEARPERGRALLDHLTAHRGPTDKANDVADPYRRGPDAARVAIDLIRGHVTKVVEALTE